MTQSYIDELNDPEVNKFLFKSGQKEYTYEEVCAFLSENRHAKNAVLFGLFINGIHKANVRLHNIENKTVWLGIAVFDQSIWGQRWGRKIVKTTAEYAVSELGLKNVFAGIDDRNTASLRIFKHAGFEPTTNAPTDPEQPFGRVWIYKN